MLRVLAFLASLLVASLPVAAEPRAVTFGGESYVWAFQDTKPSGQLLVEFVRAGETVETWGKLVTIHRFPAVANDAKSMVLSLARMLKQGDPDVRYVIRENPETGEVMIDFPLRAPGTDVVEFNVFKYAVHASGRGLIAFQFAQRFKLGKVSGEDFAKVRQASLAEAADVDMASLDALLQD
jgi:hypothetical protein